MAICNGIWIVMMVEKIQSGVHKVWDFHKVMRKFMGVDLHRLKKT